MSRCLRMYLTAGVCMVLFFFNSVVAQNVRRVNIGTHSLSLSSRGSGKPTVVIDVGIGESYRSWEQIIASITAYTRVVAYDRAGYGQSEPGPMPRNCQQEATELRSLLEKADLEPPYVLVGHSLGALNVQCFANQFPEFTAGLVLLDPPPLLWIRGDADFPDLYAMANQQTRSFLSMADSIGKSPDSAAKATAHFLRAIASEHQEMFESSGRLVSSITSFSDLPLTVIASGKPNPAFGEFSARFQRFWINESKAVAQRSTHGRFLLIEESSHHIHQDFPLEIISEIKNMLTSIRSAWQ